MAASGNKRLGPALLKSLTGIIADIAGETRAFATSQAQSIKTLTGTISTKMAVFRLPHGSEAVQKDALRRKCAL